MTIPTHPKFKQLLCNCKEKCRQLRYKMKKALHKLSEPADVEEQASLPPLSLTPLEEAEPLAQPLTATQWALGNSNEEDLNNQASMVEVEFFPNDPYSQNKSSRNYTIEGEDPTRRITHYPPSNRLH